MEMYKHTLKAILLCGLLISTACNSDKQKVSDDSHAGHNHQQRISAVEGESTGLAEITFENLEFDFGTINEGESVSHTFYFTNTGSAPLIIQSANASCGCTVPDWSKEPIPTGSSGKIDVTFDSKGKTDAQNRTVSIVANTQPSMTYLRIKGMVIPKATQAMGPLRKN